MSSILNVPISGGYVSTGTGARDASTLESGELATMKGAYLRKNDPTQVWRMPGRTLFGDAGSGAIKGMAICQFDQGGTDRLVASVGTTLVSATPGTTGTFSSLTTGLNASATRFMATHQDDRWYMCNGYDANLCLKSDGTTRLMSLVAPQEAPTTVAAAVAGTQNYPTSVSGTFTNFALAYDSDDETYATGTLSAAGTATHTFGAWASDSVAGRRLWFKFALAGIQIDSGGGGPTGDFGSGTGVGTGGTVSGGFNVTILFEKSENNGSSWTQIYTSRLTSATSGNAVVAVSANSNLIRFRATITYNSGTNPATLRLYTVRIQQGSLATSFSTTTGVYYATTEYNDSEDFEGPPSDFSLLTTLSTQNQVTVTRGTIRNAAATHWILYRTSDGAAKTLDNLGRIAKVPVAETTYVDDFDTDKDTQPLPIIPLLTIGDLSFPKNSPAPAFSHMMSWEGSICGISRTDRRKWQYSEAGEPESFPEIYVVTAFPIDEHDGLVGQMAVGETAVLLCEGAAIAVDGIPRVVDGQFEGANARPLKGHPGCVGGYAFTTFSVAGEPRGAWVSPFGVYITNGTTCECISTDLAWELEVNVPYLSTSVLRWDAKNHIIWFEFDYDGDGLNDREMPFHMGRLHSKGNGLPKLGQPTAKATSCMASALISSSYLRFSGHPSDGNVYLEESGTQDGATAAEVTLDIKTGQIGRDKVDLGIIKATVNHSEFGTGQTGTIIATLYRDAANSSNSRSQSVRLDGNRGTTVGIGRAGELVDFEITYNGTGTGGIGSIDLEIEGHGRSGSAERWASSSETA